ncbi:MAG TPA: GntR family transcriptional regulator [Bacteroidota bacterium]|nr:GntR family transcriptional regulator [Bacteroidota bacterium]
MPIDVRNSSPLYLQIIGELKSKISEGTLKPGDQVGSHAELASAYGVSLITVKKALATMIQEGVLFSRVGKGTYVAQQAGAAPGPKHKTIGLVLQDFRSPFFSRIMHSVEDAAYELGYHVLISNSSGRAEKEDAQIARFRTFGVSGLIIASMSHNYNATPTIRKLLRDGFPFVMVSYMADTDVPFVGSDHQLGGFMATEHLVKLGYERIGFINGEKGNVVGELRKQGYEAAMRASGRRPDHRFQFQLRLKGERHDYQSGYEIGKKVSKLALRPDAMFVYNDLAALGFIDAFLERGLNVPDDVAVIGFDDIERGEYSTVPLTTVRQPTDSIGKETIKMLLRFMKGKREIIRKVVKPELIIRQSCPVRKERNGKGHGNGSGTAHSLISTKHVKDLA